MEEGFVSVEFNENIARITFFHPKGNSLPRNLLRKLEESFKTVSESNNASVILLQSQGDKAFCGGASFEELSSIQDFDDAVDFFAGFGRVINEMRKSPLFIVGRVQGKAVGGALGLISACDYVVATSNASVRLSEYSLAIGPFVISNVVERKIGKSAFVQMTIDTQWYDANWALSKGLFNKVFPSIEEMDLFLRNFLKEITSRNLQTQMELKKLFWEGTDNWDDVLFQKAHITAKLLFSEDTQQIIKNLKR
ncbi:MAG: enoyl-CoA hydratase/isomerase family protein [Candidatus Kapaibacteriales bacterium]